MTSEIVHTGDPQILLAEAYMRQREQVECPVTHTFTNGMYVRTIYMPAESLIASKIHKTQHPFVVREGKVSVRRKGLDGWETFEAGHMGITEPGTHRLLFTHEDTIWTTFHPNPENITDLAELERRIIEYHEPPELPCHSGPQELQPLEQ